MERKHKNAQADLTTNFVRDILNYNPKTGNLAWKIPISRKTKVGNVAGYIDSSGRLKIGIGGNIYMAHRIIWLWVTGSWPKYEIDHINEIQSDNRWTNLREATPSQNHRNRGKQKNNTTGFKGVTFDKKRKVYISGVKLHGKRYSAGYCFKTAKEAYQAVCKLAAKLHGEWSRYK